MCHYAEDIKDWFVSYVDSYESADKKVQYNIDLKKEHTLRVCTEITRIGVSEGFSEADLRLAQTVALLHDIGRFEQYTRFKTFSDKRSVNHAELGVALVKESGVLQKLHDDECRLVLDAIKYHNLPALPEGLTERTALFAKLIRDADKLDILHLLSILYRNPDSGARRAVELTLPDHPGLSAAVVDAVYRGSIVRFADMRSADDFKLVQMAWIFDLNFAWSLKQFHERNHLKSLKQLLPDNETVRGLYAFLHNKLMERLANG